MLSSNAANTSSCGLLVGPESVEPRDAWTQGGGREGGREGEER